MHSRCSIENKEHSVKTETVKNVTVVSTQKYAAVRSPQYYVDEREYLQNSHKGELHPIFTLNNSEKRISFLMRSWM